MISKYNHKGLIWVDIESPQIEEILYALEEYPIPLFLKEEILSKKNESKIILDFEYIFARVDLSNINLNQNINDKIIFLVSDNFVLLIHSKPLKALSQFIKEIEFDILATEDNLNIKNSRLLFGHLLKNLYINSQEEIFEKIYQLEILKNKIIKQNKKLKLFLILNIIFILIIILTLTYVISYI